MKWLVEMYVAGRTFKEEVYAANAADARRTALARNPTAKIIGVNVKFS